MVATRKDSHFIDGPLATFLIGLLSGLVGENLENNLMPE